MDRTEPNCVRSNNYNKNKNKNNKYEYAGGYRVGNEATKETRTGKQVVNRAHAARTHTDTCKRTHRGEREEERKKEGRKSRAHNVHPTYSS
jgi:hypothetical protein